ncbi:NADH-quinone oxidoreductase subunit NuoG [Vibrio sp. S4M6]|uniref:NADH-quinone oxidoreductase subunit NuoG n=1 Tax=Vibrio sinus TaxID=2946865 RepID=UPI00202AB645|nr:NADH-quinone oxidoreductase subunit NuoG [Vibrio sinus]MCL9780791.1 NADH-quinone oxidoreductase subunit NuoG [Vibrio sinus]
MGTIYIDDKAVEFEPGENVLDAARRAGIEAPYFCYHPALGAAGSCRICAMETVPQKEGERPRTVMTCTIPAQDGQRYKFKSDKAKQIQKGVVEFYMTNHPNDCPVCDEGGDCHLQDTTISVGHAYRRYDGMKRTMPDQYIGPLVYQTMNRCVTCYRCVRYYQNYALGDDFGAMGSSNHVLFRRTEDGAFDSPFSGNLVTVCPTGVFTDKVYRRKYSRTWMLDKADSICSGCSVGCNIEAGGREGTLRRINIGEEGKSAVNPYFICDRGRYGAHGTEAKDRPLQVLLDGKPLADANPAQRLAKELGEAKGRVAILGSIEEDLLTNTALRQLASQLNAPFSPFTSETEEAFSKAAAAANTNAPSVKDIEQADAVLVVGELTEHAPMLDLAVRQVMKEKRPVHILHASGSHLVTASRKFQKGLSYSAAPSQWLDLLAQVEKACAGETVDSEWATNVANSVKDANKVVVLGVAELLNVAGIKALQKLTEVLGEKAQLAVAQAAAGATGAALLAEADSCDKLKQQLAKGKIDTLLVVGSDPFGEKVQGWSELRSKVKRLIVADKINTSTVKAADVVIPLAAWPERNGMTINYEGRLQSFAQSFKRKEAMFSAEVLIEQMADVDQEAINNFLAGLTQTHPTAGSHGVRLDAEKLAVKLSAKEQQSSFNFAKAEQPQVALSRWYGEGYIADRAEELASLKPNAAVYVSAEFAHSMSLANGDRLTLKAPSKHLTRTIVVDKHVAQSSVVLSRADVNALGLDIASAIQVEKAADLFIDATNVESSDKAKAAVGEA